MKSNQTYCLVLLVIETKIKKLLRLMEIEIKNRKLPAVISAMFGCLFWRSRKARLGIFAVGIVSISFCCLVSSARAATNVYYSVGQSSSDLKTSSPTVTITSGAAVFSEAQSGNIGVGDKVTYNTNVVAYIAAKTNVDQMHWTLVTATGGTPADITDSTVVSITRAYTSLSAAEAGATDSSHINNTDLTAADVVLNLPCYYDTGADTTAVTINDYTTDATRYIKIYTPNNTSTESNFSQRHSGKWDETKYRLETSNATSINISDNHVQIDGLQIKLTAANTNSVYGIITEYQSSGSEIRISNNIIKGVISGTSSAIRGIITNAADANAKVWNNVIYDFVNGTNDCAGIRSASSNNLYVYNNTVYNSRYAFSNPKIVKNNIAQACGSSCYSGTLDASSVNNISSDATSPNSGGTDCGGHSCLSQTVAFSDTANRDLHLAFSDAAARNSGADLAADANLAITIDIDGHTRPTGSNVNDIGADEGATHVFYSVGQSISDLKNTADTLLVSIASGTATFDEVQTGNIGVGDVIDYDVDNKKAYIASKTSGTVWRVVTATGAVPADGSSLTVNSIKHVWTTLSNAEAGAEGASYLNTTDLFTNNYVLNIPCYYDSAADTTAITINGWTTAQPNYIKAYTPSNTSTEANFSQRAQGRWEDTKYRLESSSSTAINNYINYLRIDGLQFKVTGSSGFPRGIANDAVDGGSGGELIYSNNIFQGSFSGTASPSAIHAWQATAAPSFKISNNIIYGFVNGASGNAISFYQGINYVYNNTAYNSGAIARNGGTVIVKNNLAQSCGANCYSGTFDASSSNNISSDATSPNAGSTDCGGHSCRSQTVAFTDTTNKDFHLASTDTSARNSGADLATDANLAINTDIDGHTRPTGATAVDIGADEGAAAVYYSVGQNTTDHKTGSPTITVSGTTATFSTAQLAVNMGVGDVITYNTTDKCYISGKTSTTVWTCTSATGGTPTAASAGTTVNSVAHAFNSLSAAIHGSSSGAKTLLGGTADLYSNNYQLNIPCYYDTGADTTNAAISTGVNINSWTTSAANYIRVYTPTSTTAEVNKSQRHQGAPGTGYVYRPSLSTPDNWYNIFTMNVGYIIFDGLEIDGTSVTNGKTIRGIIVYSNAAEGTDQTVSNCLIHDIKNSTADDSAVRTSTGIVVQYGNSKIYNNIVYDIENKSAHASSYTKGIELGVSSSVKYAYVSNNTAYGIVNTGNTYYARGIYKSAPTNIYLTNNIVGNVTCSGGTAVDFSGISSGATVNYNVSEDDTADDGAGTGNKVNQSLSSTFSSISNKDFHLASADTVAQGAGTSLATSSSYSYHYFPSDIDGNNRSTGGTGDWDIGADQVSHNVYYSVGQNTTDHKTGTPTITVSGTTATFSEAQTAVNMGVGDVITYNTTDKCYISGKTSTTVWSCVSATGGTPTAASAGTTVNSVAHAYASLSAATSGFYDSSHINTTDLVAGNYIVNIPCYYDTGADTTRAAFSASHVTSPQNYIKVYTPTSTTTEANVSQRHGGKWDLGKYRLESTGTSGWQATLSIGPSYMKVDGLQVLINSAYDGNDAIKSLSNTGEVSISNSIIRGTIASDQSEYIGIAFYNASGSISNAKIWNNIIYGFWYPGTSNAHAAIMFMLPNTAYVYNNTIYDSKYGIDANMTNVVVKNNITQGCSDGYFLASGSNNAGTDYNISNVAADFPGANSKNSTTVSFADTTNKDFHLAFGDTAARNSGADLAADANLAITTDIDGHTRPTGASVNDIGADEGAKHVFYSVGQSTSDLKNTADTLLVSIASGTATFDETQTGNIGVGDVIDYDVDNKKAYIASKTSGTVWRVVTATGAVPGDVSNKTVNSIKHVWTTLSNAEAGAEGASYLNTTDLYTNNYVLNIPCYYDSAADTASVTINGWTTAASNYIKVYTPSNTSTEANFSQRHGGSWDDTKYRLEITGNAAINDYVNNAKIDGIQAKVTSSSGTNSVIIFSNVDSGFGGNIEVSNNIARGDYSSTAASMSGIGVYNALASPTIKIFNNIVYDIKNPGYLSRGILVQSVGSFYVFNNTIFGNDYGISFAGGTGSFKNNISHSNVTDYYGTFTTSANNISSDSTSPNSGLTDCGGHSCRRQTVAFLDATNKNFHLASADTSARNAGTDLSADSNLAITADIDGHTRPTGANVNDVGADEGAIVVYYSVGQNTSDHKTGSPTITVSGTTATFSEAQTASNMGVGDVITYNTTDKCYISGKTSTTVWSCISTTGGTPTAASAGTTVNSVAHAYASLSAAEAGASDASHLNTSDLKTNNYQLNIPCYYDSGADNALTFNGWTTGAPNYIKIYTPNNTTSEVNVSQRHNGSWDESKYRLESTDTSALTISDEYVRVEGLQIKHTSSSVTYRYGIIFQNLTGTGETYVNNNIVRGVYSGTAANMRGMGFYGNTNLTARVYNNIVYDIKNGSSSDFLAFYLRDGLIYLYNNTVYNSYTGYSRLNATIYAKNNIAQACTDGYAGTFDASSDYNISDVDASDAPNATFTDDYANVAFLDEANSDLHLSPSDTGAKDQGVNLNADASWRINTDIDGQSRPAEADKWDIGADEVTGAMIEIKRNVEFKRNVKINK